MAGSESPLLTKRRKKMTEEGYPDLARKMQPHWDDEQAKKTYDMFNHAERREEEKSAELDSIRKVQHKEYEDTAPERKKKEYGE